MRSWLEGNSWPEIGFKMTQHFKSIKQTQTVKLHQAHWPVHTGLRCTVKANPVKHWISPVVPTPHPSPLSPLTLLLCTPTVRRVPPRFSIPPTNHEVMPGGSVNLTCVAVGAPMPYVKWISGEVELTREDEMPIGRNVLELTNIRQSANYTCVAISSLGMIETTAQITVKGKKHSPLWGWDGVWYDPGEQWRKINWSDCAVLPGVICAGFMKLLVIIQQPLRYFCSAYFRPYLTCWCDHTWRRCANVISHH